ncbi:MAG: aminomethyltransferase [Acidiferrobacteraceae bacterium]|nr:aminomethyltransferase [Acidiferrobacteraceae bacterium]
MGEKNIIPEQITIPARGGKAVSIKKGRIVKVINTSGHQVVDTWAFNAEDTSEFMSMDATRATICKLRAGIGDSYYTNRRRAILEIINDTSSGVHDTLMAACDNERYELLGCTEYHDNCADNLRSAARLIGVNILWTPSPLNLFMNIPWTNDGNLSFEEPVTRPGNYIELEVKFNAVLIFSACPQDILPINGKYTAPTEAHFQVTRK